MRVWDLPVAAGVAPSGSLWCFGEVTLSFFWFIKKANRDQSGGPEAAGRTSAAWRFSLQLLSLVCNHS